MGTMKQVLLTAALVSLTQLGVVSRAAADDNDTAARASRWQALQQALFPGRSLKDGAGIVVRPISSPTILRCGSNCCCSTATWT